MKAFAKPRSRRLRFESFELDLDTVELRKNGRRIRLQDQPGRLLALLAGKPGELVTRTEIQKTLWEEGQFVEFDHAVNTAIKKVREALDDDPDNPKILETLPRKGYRFIALVEWIEDPIVESQTLEIAPVDVSEEPPPILQATPRAENVPEVLQAPSVEAIPLPSRESTVSRLYWLSAALLLVAILMGGLALRNSGTAASNQTPEMRLEIMTSSTTDPTSLAISPDGLKVVLRRDF
jgi:DNA-binding winged helix-turn-helix (wHTH) protein